MSFKAISFLKLNYPPEVYFEGGWWMGTTLWFFKILDINMIYTFGVEQFAPKIEIALNFIYEIPLKINRTKKKGHQKIELTFSFTKEIPLKIIRNKKKSTMKFCLKNTL